MSLAKDLGLHARQEQTIETISFNSRFKPQAD